MAHRRRSPLVFWRENVKPSAVVSPTPASRATSWQAEPTDIARLTGPGALNSYRSVNVSHLKADYLISPLRKGGNHCVNLSKLLEFSIPVATLMEHLKNFQAFYQIKKLWNFTLWLASNQNPLYLKHGHIEHWTPSQLWIVQFMFIYYHYPSGYRKYVFIILTF